MPSVLGSRAVAGIVAADLAVAGEEFDPETTEFFEDIVVGSWRDGRDRHQEALYARLDELDPRLSEMLKAAWAMSQSDASGMVSYLAHGMVELLDRPLRALAPVEEVMAVVHELGLGKDATHMKDGKPHPTRSARVAYAMRMRPPGERKLVRDLTGVANGLLKQLQGPKHGGPGTVTQMRSYLQTVEAVLCQLLGVEA